MNPLDQILMSRAVRYGSFEDVSKRTSSIYHAMICQAPEFVNRSARAYHAEALHMIAHKIARLVNGQIDDADSWLDIAGYASLVHQHITESQEAKTAGETAMKAMEAKIAQEMSEEAA